MHRLHGIRGLLTDRDLPALLYFEDILLRNLRHFLDLTAEVPRRRCLYSVKAASHPFLLDILQRHGIAGFDASSATEAELVSRLFGRRAPLFVTAPALAERELETLRPLRPACVHLDSLDSLALFLDEGKELPLLGLRVNPGVGSSRQSLHEAGGPRSRLGLPLDRLGDALELFRRHGRRSVGLHFHVTCESDSFRPQAEAVRLLSDRLREIPLAGLEIAHLDVGGGLRPPLWDFERDELVPQVTDGSAAEVAGAVAELLDRHEPAIAGGFALLFEPGDLIVCSAAVLVSRVVESRRAPGGDEHLILDTNINHFPNLLQYGSRPEAVLEPGESGERRTRWSGNSCLGGDHIAEVGLAPDLVPERVVFSARGSYEYSKLNFFNGRFRPSVFLVESSGALRLVKRDTIDDLIGFWREEARPFPLPHESFLQFEEIARQERGIYLYHPEFRHVSAFELDPGAFPIPGCLRRALVDHFDRYSTTYGRSLGHREVRERIAAYENGVVGRPVYDADHAVVTLGAANAVWLTLNAVLRGGLRRLVIDAPNFYLYAFASARFGIPWSNLHRGVRPVLPDTPTIDPERLFPSLEETLAGLERFPDLGAFAVSEPGLPYGRRKPAGMLRALADRARAEGWLLISDETLGDLDFLEEGDADWSWLEPSHPVLRIKSASKTFGLAGLRLGYLCVTDAARRLPGGPGDLLDRMADLSDTAYSSPPSVFGPVLCAGLDLLDAWRAGRDGDPDVAQLRANFAKIRRRAEQAGEMLAAHGIPYVEPRIGSSLMAVLRKLPRSDRDAVPFFRALVRRHSLFLETGALFSQDPSWDFTVARFGLGRAEEDFHEDLRRFCDFYASWEPADGAARLAGGRQVAAG